MSNAERAETNDELGDARAADEGATDGLRALITHIADQITDADQRHTEMLGQMQERLQSLGFEARAIRDRVPSPYLPAFERIEEGMQLLAERIASAHEARGDGANSPTAAAAVAPPPFRSSSIASAATVHEQGGTSFSSAFGSTLGHAASTERGAAIDPFDVVDADPGRAEEPWSRADADALARLYHTHAEDDEAAASMADAESAPMFGVADPAAAAPFSVDSERAWLEERFSDIARRIELSLAEARPDNSFLAFGHRFERFEERMGAVLADVATRADVEGLRLIEAHISELTSHLERTQAHLERLDGIEAHLNAVVARLSDERFAAVSEGAGFESGRIDQIVAETASRVAHQLASQNPANPADLESVAARAAHEALSHYAMDMRAAGGVFAEMGEAGAGHDDLRSLVETFIRERRQGDEQTMAALDTMQQAMIRVLDRVDAIEMQGRRAAAPAASMAALHDDDDLFDLDPPPSVGASADPRSRHDARPGPADHAPAAAASPLVIGSGAVPGQPAAPLASVMKVSPEIGTMGAAAEVLGAPDRGSRIPIDKLRQDFIADARRAKERAQSAIDEPAAPAASSPAGTGSVFARLMKSKAVAAPVAAPKAPALKSEVAGAGKPQSGATPTKKILVAALGLVIIVLGANLLLARRGGDAPKPVATHEAPMTEGAKPAAAAGNAAIHGGEPSSGMQPSSGSLEPESMKPDASAKPNPSTFVLPNTSHQPQTIPETVVEDLNMQEKAAGTAEDRFSMADTASIPHGIAVQEARQSLTPHDLARLRQRQQMAELSSRLGAAAAATPASLMPDVAAAPSSALATGAIGGEGSMRGRSALDLPPLTVGPLSLRLAAAKGDPSAEFEVGARLAEGKGTDQSFKEAVKWYTRSANQGFAQAQYRLGTLYERGLGVAKDPARARVWYSRAAEQGNVKAMHNLAVLNAGGKSGGPDYATASHWFAEAAERGLADSQFNLAVLYDSGLGVNKDLAMSYHWFAIAARSGDKEAMRRRDAARAALSPQQVQSIDERISAWQPRASDAIINDARAAGEAWKVRQAAEENS